MTIEINISWQLYLCYYVGVNKLVNRNTILDFQWGLYRNLSLQSMDSKLYTLALVKNVYCVIAILVSIV